MATDQLARGLAARTFATARANTIAVEEFGARSTGDSRAAIQRAIDTAVATGIPRVTCRLPRMDVWEPVLDDPNGSGLAWLNRNRTIRIPACEAIDIDFGGAKVAIKGPTGGPALPGQAAPSLAGFGGFWSGGFLTVTGLISRLRIANVTCDGGYTGDAVTGVGINLFSKGFLCQDLGDANLGVGNGFGTLILDNVTLHSFAGEIMYDNSSRDLIATNCHFYNSPQSCWNPNGIGRVAATNLQAGISTQVAEILGGKGRHLCRRAVLPERRGRLDRDRRTRSDVRRDLRHPAPPDRRSPTLRHLHRHPLRGLRRVPVSRQLYAREHPHDRRCGVYRPGICLQRNDPGHRSRRLCDRRPQGRL